jgi:Glycosyltransferase family 87
MTRCYLAFAAFAAALGLFSDQPIERCWGSWAAVGYAVAAAVIAFAHRRRLGTGGVAAAHAVALGCAIVAPLAWQAWAGLPSHVGEGSLTVIVQAGRQLLDHGTPYLPAASLSRVLAYDPYEPLMAVFGLPRAAGAGALTGWAGDPRLWLTLTGTAVLYFAFRLAAADQGAPGRTALRNTVVALASPVISLQVATGGTDVPVIALLCLSLVLAARSPRASGVAAGIACALKATAWPALPVLAATLAVTRGRAQAGRFALLAALTAVAATTACAPAGLRDPGSPLRNAVLFPLGLTWPRTPAASPLPGHLLATAGPAGRWAALALLAAVILVFAWWLAVRPPRDTRAAAARLAVGLTAAFTFAPATRWGYFAYPLALAGWRALTGPHRMSSYSSERPVVTPAESSAASLDSAASPASVSAPAPRSVDSVTAASAVATWSADASLTAPRGCGERTTTGRSGRPCAQTNQARPTRVIITAMYMFSRRPKKYSEESIRTDSSKMRNPE